MNRNGSYPALVQGWVHPYGLQMVNRKGRWWVER
jgi:hypothetical protein